ncbi:SAC3 GANP Nin1 mts3 eIF-3 p25 and WD40 repeat domain containing protein [Aphelenchoides besseyi]|nr:SAC3 GANP Nin1 mts3 eIF-3 p25 and WD40 repeat domain containing protein [Aphelenchoides besseyi]
MSTEVSNDMCRSAHTVTAIAWIGRGIASSEPQTIAIDPSTLKQLIDSGGGVDETTDSDVPEENEGRARGSAPKKESTPTDPSNPDDKYNMEDYDKEVMSGPSMKGLAVFASQQDDPYITSHKDDSEDERETEAMKIQSNDNLAVVGKFDGDDATMLVYLYNAESGDFYVHHDYPICAPILCLEPIGYDPGVDSKKGNLIGVGTMEPVIEIWDLDIVNAVKPVVKLGSQNSNQKRKKRDGSAQCHTDAVLSLSWNREADHLLASGGADEMVVLWDLDAAKVAQNLPRYNGMVQSLEWQPNQSSMLLAGTRTGKVRLDDGRLDSPVAEWSFDSSDELEVEMLRWDKQNEHYAFVLTSDGKLRYLDTRKPGEVVFEVQSHESEASSLALSATAGLVVTTGGEEARFWQLNKSNGSLNLVGSRQFHLSKIRAAAFCPDVPSMLLLGGEKESLVHLYDVARHPACAQTFPDLKPATELQTEETVDIKVEDVEMEE